MWDISWTKKPLRSCKLEKNKHTKNRKGDFTCESEKNDE